ncbi:MAG: hypothetical protein M0021_02190 [Clostridia bacterium]|nr:hypothetical protein [Clostridia bacterium]
MYGLIIIGVILGLGLIGYIYYQNQQLRQLEQDKSAQEQEAIGKLELERLKKERQEKQRLERERAVEAEAQARLRKEIEPVLEIFLAEHEWQSWIKHMEEAEAILEGRPISVQELLQHNVVRKFPDGSFYRVGLIKQMPDGEYSILPEKVEALQEYFVCFLEFSSHLKSQSVSVNKLQLHRILRDEFRKKARRLPMNSLN